MADFETLWAEAVAALDPRQRLVLFQDNNGPQIIQVLAPEPPEDDTDDEPDMRPRITSLAAYPSKGLGDLKAALAEIPAKLAALKEAAK